MQAHTVTAQHDLNATGNTPHPEAAAPTMATEARKNPDASIFGDSVSIRTLAFGCYAASLAGLLSGGLLTLAALLVAFIQRPTTQGTLYETHFTWLINSILISMALSAAGMMLSFVLIPLTLLAIPALGLLGLWFVYRMAKGMIRLNADQPMN